MGLFDDDEPKEKFQREKGEYCEVCGRAEKWMELFKCPMCHKHVCDKCHYGMGGKIFCSDSCANEFFWGGEDGQEDE